MNRQELYTKTEVSLKNNKNCSHAKDRQVVAPNRYSDLIKKLEERTFEKYTGPLVYQQVQKNNVICFKI